MTHYKSHKLLVFLLLTVATFLRFYRLEGLTEFLGDQGRTGIVIYQAWQSRHLPLVGPPVLTGQYLGPFFYYLIGPAFIFSGFRPEFAVFFMVALGVATVYLLFRLGAKIFGFWTGLAIAAIYATLPTAVSADRVIWEPNVIPFFIVLYLLAVYKLLRERYFPAFLFMGLLVGILVQLHYPNIFFIGLSGLAWSYIIFTRKKHEPLATFFGWSVLGVSGFVVVLFPFLVYEGQHKWLDLREIALIFLTQGETGVRAEPLLTALANLSLRSFGRVFTLPNSWAVISAELIFLGVLLFQRSFWSVFLGIWYMLGILGISFYKGTIFDHYLNFLLLPPLIFLGNVISQTKKYVGNTLWAVLVLLLVGLNLQKTDFWSNNLNNDIARTRKITETIFSLANGKPFSFTLISSRSFSDLHYRYFFLTSGINPQPLGSQGYNALFLVCEKTPCPSASEMQRQTLVKALCFDPHCSGEYPQIDLRQWRQVEVKDVSSARIYVYKRESL